MRRVLVVGLLVAVPLLAIGGWLGVRATSGEPEAATRAEPAGSVLNPHPAAGPFEVDDTEVEGCASQDGDTRPCFEQAFGNVAYRTSAKEALALATARGAELPEVASNCHRIAHTIGAAVLARLNGDVATALAEGDSTCWSGFYHGLLERALAPARSTGELGRLIRTICDSADESWSTFMRYQCLHGIGHGLMLRTGNALETSLDLCTRLADPWSRQSCDGGVFMEGFSPSLDDKPPPFDGDDPLAPCPTVAEGHKLYCYLQVADNLVRGRSYDWQQVAGDCGTEAVSTWRAICFQSYGRQASGNNYGAPRQVVALCAIAGSSGESDCVYGAVRDIASNAASGVPARTFCQVVGGPLRGRCYEGMGTIIATLETDESSVRARCSELGGGYRRECELGAGLTPGA